MASPFTPSRCPSRLAKETSDESVQQICTFTRTHGAVPVVDDHGDTLLHFIAIYGNLRALAALVDGGLLTSRDYMAKNAGGDTALHQAARFWQIGVARVLVREETRLMGEVNGLGENPVFVAAVHGDAEVFELLAEYGGRSGCMRKRNDGRTILHAAVARQHYYLACKILEQFPEMAHEPDQQGATALLLLARSPSSFRSGSTFMLAKLGMSLRIFIHLFNLIIYLLVPLMFEKTTRGGTIEDRHDHEVIVNKLKMSPFIRILLCCSSDTYYAKQSHMLSLLLTKRLVQVDDEKILQRPLIEAAKNGVVEIATEILTAWPDVALKSYDECGRNILLVAVAYKQKYIYNHLKKTVVQANWMETEVDVDGNTIQHLAASKHEIPDYPNSIMHVLKLMWDMSWFQRAGRDLDPSLKNLKNHDGKTAVELFDEAHQKLREEAMKPTQDSMKGPLVVSSLVATVTFTTLFTIPGGFSEAKGTPILYDTNQGDDLKLLMSYIWAVLFSSTLSSGTLMVLHNPYHLHDFNIIVPMAFLVSHTGLFFSTSFTFAAIIQAFVLENSMALGYFTGMLFLFVTSIIHYTDFAFPLVSHLMETICGI